MPTLMSLPFLLALATSSGSPPPPGLYEVSTRTVFENGEASAELSQDGRTGTDTMRTSAGGVTHAQGSGPVRACVGNGPSPAQLAGLASLPTTIRYTRLDADRWQADLEVVMPAPGSVPVSSIAPMLAAARAHATPAERAKIDAMSAQLPQMQKQQDAAKAELRAQMLAELPTADADEAQAIRATLASLDGGPGTGRTQRATQVYHRIGDHCSP